MITQIINGKRRVPEDFNAFDGHLDTLKQIFKECKLNSVDFNRLSMTTKSGKNLILLIDMEHMYPNFSLSINSNLEYFWAFIPESSYSNKEWLFHKPHGDGEIIGKRIILNDILEKIRVCWNNK